MKLKEIFHLVEKERVRQIEMWGVDWDLHPETYLRIMVTEVSKQLSAPVSIQIFFG